MTSPIDANKAVVRAFFDTLNSQGIYAAIQSLPDEATIWSVAGTWTKQQYLDRASKLGDILVRPMQIALGSITAEDDRVAVEANSSAKFKGDMEYANVYHFLFRVQHGKIVGFREHHNTKHHAVVLERALSQLKS